jgi:hypothetical protein
VAERCSDCGCCDGDRCPWLELEVDEAADEDAVADDALEVLRVPPADAGVVVVWVGLPGVGRVVSAMNSSANPAGNTSRRRLR